MACPSHAAQCSLWVSDDMSQSSECMAFSGYQQTVAGFVRTLWRAKRGTWSLTGMTALTQPPGQSLFDYAKLNMDDFISTLGSCSCSVPGCCLNDTSNNCVGITPAPPMLLLLFLLLQAQTRS